MAPPENPRACKFCLKGPYPKFIPREQRSSCDGGTGEREGPDDFAGGARVPPLHAAPRRHHRVGLSRRQPRFALGNGLAARPQLLVPCWPPHSIRASFLGITPLRFSIALIIADVVGAAARAPSRAKPDAARANYALGTATSRPSGLRRPPCPGLAFRVSTSSSWLRCKLCWTCRGNGALVSSVAVVRPGNDRGRLPTCSALPAGTGCRAGRWTDF